MKVNKSHHSGVGIAIGSAMGVALGLAIGAAAGSVIDFTNRKK